MELSGKTLAAAIFAMVVLVAGLTHAMSGLWPQKNASPVAEHNRARTDTDSDGDGLKDWEEVLVGTDPANPDTDGNGVSDYEEVQRVRAALTTSPAEQTNTSTTPANKTDMLAKDLFGAYASAKRMGTYNATEFQNVVEAVAKEPFADLPKPYTQADLTIIAQPTAADKTNYAHAVRTALSRTDTLGEYELTIFARAVADNSTEDYALLEKARGVYATIADELTAMHVPQDATSTHVALLNGFSRFSFALDKMVRSQNDPALSFPAINTFLESEDMIKAAFSSFSIYLSLNK